MSQKGDGALGGLEVSTTPGSDGVGAVFVNEEGGEGEQEFEVVGARCMLEHVFDQLCDSHLYSSECVCEREGKRCFVCG